MKLHRLHKQIVWAPSRVYQEIHVSVMFVKTGLVRLFLHREEDLLSRGGGGGWGTPLFGLKGYMRASPHVRAPRRVCSQARC